ncbi:MAG: TusE/DsrC/DsvC family sulfur relay protein [Pseudohongiellaceae bacterium]
MAVDSEGFLRQLKDWSPEVAEQIAVAEGIRLTSDHWELISLVRDYYQQKELTLPMRPLVNLVLRELGSEKGRSIYLLKLFPGSPAKLINKIAGLPKPSNCI